MAENLTINHTIDSLSQRLRGYLEAQYHIKDEGLLAERKQLLAEDGTVVQHPYLEATPAYALAKTFDKLQLPEYARSLLSTLSSFDLGIYPKPYVHQAKAIEAFLKGHDIMAATGTGSGKTEIFLFSILCMQAEEAKKRPEAARLRGMRALILYPMNALVADQLARIRKIYGNPQAKAEFKRILGRHPTFGMYTGRTPFPGLIESKTTDANDLYNYYINLLSNSKLQEELQKRGKWPAKDLVKFFGEKGASWKKRLKTDPDDTELLMRHEMQQSCPDLLITNYSMLEYMLLRPIEKNIFDETATYLKEDGTYLTVVLDEAHMYRGATGAEVSFLLKRLRARLGISRDKMRFILTTASVGSKPEDDTAALEFAKDLTGARDTSKISFIKGEKEIHLAIGASATKEQGEILCRFDINTFHSHNDNPFKVAELLNETLSALGLGPHTVDATDESTVKNHLYAACGTFGPAVKLLEIISGNATEWAKVGDLIFPANTHEDQLKALDSLIVICNYAKQTKTNKVFLPARLHLFYRGLSGIYACVDPRCTHRRAKNPNPILGKLHSEPMTTCQCGARVYELLTHRDCGAAYLRVYADKRQDKPDFLWHEPSTYVDVGGKELQEMRIHISDGTPAFPDKTTEAWLQISSGKVSWTKPSKIDGWRTVYFARDATSPETPADFDSCPACTKRTSIDGQSRVMDLRTKGEQPFSQLVQQQLISQPVDKKKDIKDFPNQGRKVLLFSDGRQKAAKLAKNIPEEVEADGVRQLLAVAHKKLPNPNEATLTKLYRAFVATCADLCLYPFDRDDAKSLRNEIKSYREVFNSNFGEYWSDASPKEPQTYKAQVYRQVSGGLYSLRFMVAGWLAPANKYQKSLKDKHPYISPENILAFCVEWLHDMARSGAIDDELADWHRPTVVGFSKPIWGAKGTLPERLKTFFGKLHFQEGGKEGDLDARLKSFEEDFLASFCATKGASGKPAYFIKPDRVSLAIDFGHKWILCKKCGEIAPYAIANSCPSCSSPNIQTIDPNSDPYVISRKGYWRVPLKEAFEGKRNPMLMQAEEHTAQLSHKDNVTGKTLTEEYELRFQDITPNPEAEPPVDVLSCTTTMEVGIDIGSLVAVGLRNVPPQRENYQQRAGRAGRRGSSVSTVVTYCQGGAHDAHYFTHVSDIASGQPRELNVKSKNAKIARRHLHAYLIQVFFEGKKPALNSDISSSLGSLKGFFEENGNLSVEEFERWVSHGLAHGIEDKIVEWLGDSLDEVPDVSAWVKMKTGEFISTLKTALKTAALDIIKREEALTDYRMATTLLDFLFDRGVLPTYAFPRSLATFKVEGADKTQGVFDRYLPAQSLNRALTEYAPGRIITIDKQEFKSAVVTANVLHNELHRAERLFNDLNKKPYIFCDSPQCSYVEDIGFEKGDDRIGVECPLCKNGKLKVMEMITPEVFLPKDGKPINEQIDEQDFSYATPAQFPVPVYTNVAKAQQTLKELSSNLKVIRVPDAELVVVNKGDTKDKSGFLVCSDCGTAKLLSESGHNEKSHNIPYFYTPKPREYPRKPKCTGQWKNVFLGNRFSTDLVMLRIKLESPLCSSSENPFSAEFAALNDGLLTLANALPIAAGLRFDVDASEFSSGFRFVKDADRGLFGEVYMFDNLSGGAGYSERAGEIMEDLLSKEVNDTLTACTCNKSCYSCLRHYHNQFYHHSLDRNLALDLLNYALHPDKSLPEIFISEQRSLLKGLAAMAEFKGDEIKWGEKVDAQDVPLTIVRGSRNIHLFVTPPLLAESCCFPRIDAPGISVHTINAYKLTRNLPTCFLDVDKWLK